MIKMKIDRKKSFRSVKVVAVFVVIALIVTGVATAIRTVADWGAGHQFVGQRMVDLTVRFPFRIEERKQEIIIRPIVERVATEVLTPMEQKIIDKWGFKDGVVALAIFDCGESGLDQYAVSYTGDLGVAQINWRTWKNTVKEKFGYNAADMFDVDKNLDVAYMIWDRGDTVEGNKEGNWNAWTGFTNGSYTRCFNK